MSDLAKPVKGKSYHRPQKRKSLRVVWRDEDGRDRSKAFKWIGPAQEHAKRYVGPPNSTTLIVNLDRGMVRSVWLDTEWREPTDAERARLQAMKMTIEAR